MMKDYPYLIVEFSSQLNLKDGRSIVGVKLNSEIPNTPFNCIQIDGKQYEPHIVSNSTLDCLQFFAKGDFTGKKVYFIQNGKK